MYDRENEDYERDTEPAFDYYENYETTGMIFFSKCVPVLTIGMILWMVSTLAFGGVLFEGFTLGSSTYIAGLVGYFVGWIATFFLAYRRENTAAMILFFVTTFATGIIEAPIIMWASYMLASPQMAYNLFLIASIMGVLATGGALLIGRYLGRRIPQRLWVGAFVLLIILVPTELIILWVVGFNQAIFWTSIVMFVLIFITILYDGAHLKESIEFSWMLPVMNIFLDLVVMIIRIFIIIVSIVSDR